MEIYPQILKWLDEGKRVALATVIQKQGSALRGIGSKIAVTSQMEMAGSVSGGCVEGAVVEEALQVMKTGRIAISDYGIADETAWSVGLACGGKIKILIQPIDDASLKGLTRESIQDLIELKSNGKSFCLLTDLSDEGNGDVTIISKEKFVFPEKKPLWVDKDFLKKIANLEKTETSGILKTDLGEIYAEFTFPNPRLVIIGAVHIAAGLVEMAHLCGYTTIIIDPRKAFATPKRFPLVDQLVVEWPTDGLSGIGLNSRDFLVTLSHDEKFDLPALQMALDAQCRYIGMLSSRKTCGARYAELESQGYRLEEIKKIHAPVGLDLGARTTEEIALSILAEITACRYGKENEKK